MSIGENMEILDRYDTTFFEKLQQLEITFSFNIRY